MLKFDAIKKAIELAICQRSFRTRQKINPSRQQKGHYSISRKKGREREGETMSLKELIVICFNQCFIRYCNCVPPNSLQRIPPLVPIITQSIRINYY